MLKSSAGLKPFYAHTYFRISQFVYRFIRNRDEGKDVLQDIYTTLWEQLPGISDDDKVYPLLRTYATNIMINKIKKSARAKKENRSSIPGRSCSVFRKRI